jgi:hypothetical protein
MVNKKSVNEYYCTFPENREKHQKITRKQRSALKEMVLSDIEL